MRMKTHLYCVSSIALLCSGAVNVKAQSALYERMAVTSDEFEHKGIESSALEIDLNELRIHSTREANIVDNAISSSNSTEESKVPITNANRELLEVNIEAYTRKSFSTNF